jgi:hypothetical protein
VCTESTYACPDAKDNTAMASGIGLPGVPGEATPAATPYKAPTGRPDGQTAEGEQPPSEGDFDDDDIKNSLSLTAIEAELNPKVVETFDKIADTYKRLRRLCACKPSSAATTQAIPIDCQSRLAAQGHVHRYFGEAMRFSRSSWLSNCHIFVFARFQFATAHLHEPQGDSFVERMNS